MSNNEEEGSQGGYQQEAPYGRKPKPGDDNVSPWKYYGTIALVVLMGLGVVISLFLA
jgi:hypothetical protein